MSVNPRGEAPVLHGGRRRASSRLRARAGRARPGPGEAMRTVLRTFQWVVSSEEDVFFASRRARRKSQQTLPEPAAKLREATRSADPTGVHSYTQDPPPPDGKLIKHRDLSRLGW